LANLDLQDNLATQDNKAIQDQKANRDQRVKEETKVCQALLASPVIQVHQETQEIQDRTALLGRKEILVQSDLLEVVGFKAFKGRKVTKVIKESLALLDCLVTPAVRVPKELLDLQVHLVRLVRSVQKVTLVIQG